MAIDSSVTTVLTAHAPDTEDGLRSWLDEIDAALAGVTDPAAYIRVNETRFLTANARAAMRHQSFSQAMADQLATQFAAQASKLAALP